MTLSHVMVVDDSEPDQFLCKLAFKKFNPDIEILQAYDGEEALEVLAELDAHPEVIFLDINMPRMDGHEFLEEYSRVYEEQATVVVMLTSSDDQTDRTRSKAFKSVKKYLVKPIDANIMNELAKLID